MCGIIGYIGKNNALKVITDGLKQLEYRGYDSAGIAIKNNNEIKISFFMVLLFSCLIIRKQKLYQTNHVFPSSGRSPVPYRVG